MITVIFLCLNLFCHSPVIELAKTLAESGNYYEAVTEYKRFIFYSRDSMEIAGAWREIGKIYQSQCMFAEAKNAFKTAVRFASDDSFQALLRIDLGINYLVSNDLSQGELELLRVATFTSYPQIRQRAYLFFAVSCLYRQQFDDALNAFHLAFDSLSSERQLIDSLLNPQKWPRKLSPNVALWLSTFIPGAGQIYAGDWRNGINALILNTAFILLVARTITTHNFEEAVFVYLPLFCRYYWGNRLKAREIANLRNKNEGRILAHKILTAFSNLGN
ncbi:MAG: hypothetical protein ABIK38_05450 [candidate division WOR-3 bacterium]